MPYIPTTITVIKHQRLSLESTLRAAKAVLAGMEQPLAPDFEIANRVAIRRYESAITACILAEDALSMLVPENEEPIIIEADQKTGTVSRVKRVR